MPSAASVVEAMMGLRGFAVVGAMVLVSELGGAWRFGHPRQLMAYLGLVPSENTSSDKRRQGSITKAGNSHARRLLIEAAQQSHRCGGARSYATSCGTSSGSWRRA